MEMTENRLLHGRIAPALLQFALPFMLASFLQSVYGAVDLFVVGQYADAAAVSAVSIGSQLMMIATCLIMGISMGGTVLIGRRIGENDPAGTARAVGNLAFLFVCLAIGLTPVMLLACEWMIRVMQTPAEAVAPGIEYLTICSAGLPFIIGYNAVSGIYRGIGDSKTPVYFIAIACAVNVGLDFLFVGLCGMGAGGAAYATVIAQAVSFFCALWHLKRKGFAFPFSAKCFAPKKIELAEILKVGVPLALQDVLVHFSFLAIAAIINTLGLIASAGVGVAEKLMGFAFIPPSSFSSAVATMVAQNVGAKQAARARQSLKWGIVFSLICGTAVCVLCNTIPEVMTGIFTKDADVIRAAAQYLRTYSIDCALVSFVFNMNAFLNGYGRSIICFAHSMGATFLVRIPLTWVMSRFSTDSLLPMGLAAPAASIFSIVVCMVFLGRMRKKEMAE